MDTELSVVAEKLKARYGDMDGALIDTTVEQEASRLRETPVQSFLPLLVERAARLRLDSTPDSRA
jgi:hypothetical protein